MRFKGAARKLRDDDLPRVGAIIGVGEDHIHAVLDVESSGSGFDAAGRPKMLFEPHVFYRSLAAAKRERAVREGLAHASWRPGAYPSDSYPRLARAIEIDETAALKAASWGLGQILGENHRAAGFATPQAMVEAFAESEGAQLEGMIRFIKSNGLDVHLRKRNWAAFARGYNGPAYAQHGYDRKLAAAYAKWAGIKDTPWDPTKTPPDVETAPVEPPAPKPVEPKPAPKRIPPVVKKTAPIIVVGTGAAGAAKKFPDYAPYIIGAVVVVAVIVGAFILIKRRKRNG